MMPLPLKSFYFGSHSHKDQKGKRKEKAGLHSTNIIIFPVYLQIADLCYFFFFEMKTLCLM